MLQFRLGTIPVRVHAAFLLTVLLLNATSGVRPAELAIWAVVVFVSVLIHELGHALVGRSFGLVPAIDIHGMGGTTSWTAGKKLGTVRDIAISLAGPFAGFIFGACVFAATRLGLAPVNELGIYAVRQLLWVNIGWGIVNLVPMLPLDGGNVMRSVLNGLTNGRGEKAARFVSIAIAALILGLAIMFHAAWFGILAAMFGFMNIQALRQVDRRSFDAPLEKAIESAYGALQRQDGAAAIEVLTPALVPQASASHRQVGLRLLAYGLLLEGRWSDLLPLLSNEREVIGEEELTRYAKTARELGREEDASRIEGMLAPAAIPLANDFRA